MQEKKRIPLKRLHRLRNARKQAAETDDLTPMMKAIKAVHSVTSTGSTQPEDLERQRAAQELFGRLVTPNLLINTTPITVNNVSAEWVRMNQGHDRRHVVLYCHAAATPAASWAMPACWPANWRFPPGAMYSALNTALPPKRRILPPLTMPCASGTT